MLSPDKTEAKGIGSYENFDFRLVCREAIKFIYVNIIKYQYVGDNKAPFIRVIDSKQRLKNGSPCDIEPTHRIVLAIWNTGKVILTLNFKEPQQDGRVLSTAISFTIFFRTLSPTKQCFWGLSRAALPIARTFFLACSQKDWT